MQRTDIGVLPSDWRLLSLGKITKLMTNGFVGTATKHYAPEETGAIYLQGYNVEENSFNLSGVKYVTHSFHLAHQKSCLREGDLLTVQTGDVGLTTVVPPSLVGANCHALIISRLDKSAAEPRYVSQYLNCTQGRARLKLIETGTTMKHLNVGDMLGFLVPQPPLAEQRAIADALTGADALIDSLEQLLTKKRQIKQGAMQELLTGKRRLEGFHQEWRNQPFDAVLERINAKRNQIQASEYQDVGTLPVVDQGQTTPVAYSDAVDARFKCPTEGALIFGDHTCITKFVNFDFVVGADGVQVLVARQGHNTRFHAYQLELNGIESTGYNRHFKFLLERSFLCPALDEQAAIAQVLSDMDAEISALDIRLTKARALKQAMAQALLTGRIRLVEPTT